MAASYYDEGVTLPKTPKRGEKPEPWGKTRVVGKGIPRMDAHERVSGEALYYNDMKLPGMLYGAILRCPYGNAKVRRVDTRAAERMPGVHAVIYGGHPVTRMYHTYGTWADPEAQRELFPEQCRYEGEAVAAVAAETPYQACDALRAIKVDYEVLPFVVDELEALKPGAPVVWGSSNKRTTDVYERGDLAKGFADADVVVEESYKVSCFFHNTPETSGCLASWDGDSLNVWTGTQGVFSPLQAELSTALGLPKSKCRVSGKYTGGGFGGKGQTWQPHIIAPLLAKVAGRPVKIADPREAQFADGGNSPPHNMKVKAGVKKDGTLTAFHYETINTGGFLSSGGIFWYDRPIRDQYLCPNLKTEGTDVYINASLTWPFRAPCHYQATYAMELMMDQLAEKIGMDPVDFRLKNIPSFSQDWEGNPPYSTTGLRECIEEGAKAFGWKEARKRTARQKGDIRRGVGMATGSFEMGFIWPPVTVLVELSGDGTVKVNSGTVDLGTGTKTWYAQIVAEELGIKPEYVDLEIGDTAATTFSQVSAGSRTTPTDSPAVREACIDLKQKLIEAAAKDLKVDPSELEVAPGEVYSTVVDSKRVKFTDLSELKNYQVLVGMGRSGANPPNKRVKPFCVHFCEVEVNTKTMEVKVLRYVATQDSGRVMNKLTLGNQMVGGSVQGISHVLSEARVMDRAHMGRILNKNMHDYKVATIKDVPTDWTTLFIEPIDPDLSSSAAKGGGEPPRVPPNAAVANAIYNATGIRFTTSPINPLQLKA